MKRARLLSLLLPFLATACPERARDPLPLDHPSVRPPSQRTRGLEPCPTDETGRIYFALQPTCVGCHGAGTNRPFFESEGAFRALLAFNTAYVLPGDAANSELVRLLEGEGTGAFTQMPSVGDAYADLPADQQGASLGRIRTWINTLTPEEQSEEPDVNEPTTRRLKAEEIVSALYAQLGLTADDFVQGTSSNFNSPTLVLQGDLPVYSPDAAPGLHYVDQNLDAGGRWRALGGALYRDGAARSSEVSPALLQTLTQMSYAWCAQAVRKDGNTVLFSSASRGNTSAANAVAIRQNIADMHLRMLGEVASSERIEDVFTNTFVAHEAEGSDVAWTAVCASLVQDPLWLAW